MPELICNDYSSGSVREIPPWKRNHSDTVRLKIPLSHDYQDYCSSLSMIPSTPVKDKGLLSRDCNGLYFSPSCNPSKKYLIVSSHNNKPSKNTQGSFSKNSFKSIQNGVIPKRLFQ
ncbi:hypothetical protein HZS_4002 [Henneguya salminicola]|nr:hypothetical protein HZS_4002 [Henneguya salminicola]